MKTILLRSPRLPSDPFLDRAEKSAANAAASEQAAAESQEAAQQSASGSAQSSQLADEARVKAEAAQGKAETAQQAAELAQGEAETAQGAAVFAQGKAEVAQQAAEAAQGKAETAQQAAEAAQSKTEQSEAAALKSATEAAEDATVILDQTSKAIDASNAAQAAKSEAVRAKEDATAIVHNDEGTTTPTPGAYPVADSKGHLDIGWTPLLAAMYPYSGVIGTIDKDDLFEFGQYNSSWSNRFKTGVNNRVITANIAGRFVRIDNTNTIIVLPEAESTAARAIAFDDIFLDWNGTITTYRSITPHRTTTGYDRDKIATEHGYSKIQTGLYKTGDSYALLLGRVARRNQGAYHPVFNPEGAGAIKLATQPWARYWYSPEAQGMITSLETAMTNGRDGNIAGEHWTQGRQHDHKLYDAIYADDFTPLYYSAKNVVDRQALLFDSFNRAVAGETFSGAEGTKVAVFVSQDPIVHSQSNNKFIMLHVQLSNPLYNPDDIIIVKNPTTNKWAGMQITSQLFSNSHYFLELLPSSESFDTTGMTSSWGSTVKADYFYFSPSNSARPQFLMVDIIGAQEAWPEEWKTNGIPGNWLAVGEEGESLIPDGTAKNFKLSRKRLNCYQVLETRDKGLSWTDKTSTYKSRAESSTNSISYEQSQGLDADQCLIIFYKTSCNPFELSPRSTLISMTDGYASNYAASQSGPVLCSNLINKIPTATGYGAGFHFHYPLTKTTIDESRKLLQSSHAPLEIAKAMPGFKALGYLSVEASRLFMNACYKEVRVKDNALGDDGLLKAHNNQTTETDLNGESVIVGTKRVELPYQFSGEQL